MLDARVRALAHDLAAQLAGAWRAGTTLPLPQAAPADPETAYEIQRRFIALRGGAIGGWKIGARSPTGPIQGSPLPAAGVLPSPAAWSRRAHLAGIELEIAFRFGRVFDARDRPYADQEVFGAIEAVGATIELVASRWSDWPRVDPLLQLGDLQNHGGLVCSEWQRYDPAFSFVAPTLQLTAAGVDVHLGQGTNPAGDPRRLLPWVVEHARVAGLRIEPETVITTGSYVGLIPLSIPADASAASAAPVLVVGTIAGLQPVRVTIS